MSPTVQHPISKFLLLIVIFSIFLSGYFPSSTAVTGITETRDRVSVRQPRAWTRRAGHLVIMVIDALRADFVLDIDTGLSDRPGHKIQFLQELLRDETDERRAVGFVTRASPPTVTLPRIKV